MDDGFKLQMEAGDKQLYVICRCCLPMMLTCDVIFDREEEEEAET